MENIKFVIEKSARIDKLVSALYEKLPEIEADRGVLVTESEEWAQTQCSVRMGINKSVTNHKLCALVNPQQLLTKNNATYTVSDSWC